MNELGNSFCPGPLGTVMLSFSELLTDLGTNHLETTNDQIPIPHASPWLLFSKALWVLPH